MYDFLLVPIALVYLVVVGLLFIYGINFFYLTYIALRHHNDSLAVPGVESWPRVTVQLPVYNELYVTQRLVEAAASLDYPAHLLEIQLLDDSTDETVEIARQAVAKARARGVQIQHIHRQNRVGYKAGALAAGLQQAQGEFLAIFDADFIPPKDFLRRAIPFFIDPNDAQSSRIAFIQARWGHVNRDYSLLTRLQSLAIDAHFTVEQYARWLGGYWFNFNGTAGVWRREAIEDAGGWKADTLTEDLDLSYRAFLKGWRALYLRDLEVPAELPVSFSAYRRQQHRWSRGSLECALKFLPQVWNAPINWKQKVQASLHLTGYGVHLLLFALTLLYPLVLVLSLRYPELISLFGIAFVFNATAFAPTVFFIAAQHQLGRRWWRMLPAVFFITSLGAGMMVNTVRAASQIFFGGKKVFERTPKYGITQNRQAWVRQKYQLHLDPLVMVELLWALINAATLLLAIHLGNWVIAVYSSIFALGLFFTSGLTIAQALQVQRHRLSQVITAGATD